MCNKRRSLPHLKHCQEINHLRITMARIVLLLLFVAIASAIGQPIEPNCDQYRLLSGVPCPEDDIPVCGTDGRNYRNECKLCLEIMDGFNIKIAHMGEC
nr:trypsin inhibitor ClTI-1-like [Misgurnus anguillicaudatus]